MSRLGDPDPNLLGLPIRDFGKLCNMITSNGAQISDGFVGTTNGKSYRFRWETMGIPLVFEAKRDHKNFGIALEFSIESRHWRASCLGSKYPPATSEATGGHYADASYDIVEFVYLPMTKQLRYIFGFEIWLDSESYVKDMTILRMVIAGG